jgi:hypothetical protein
MRFILVILILLLNEITFAQMSAKCISLEGVHLGCVPSESHPCIRLVVNNVEEITDSNPTGNAGSSTFNCMYIKEIRTERRNPQTGPLALNCQSWKPGFNPSAGNETGIDRNAMCDVFSNPVCDQICTLCTPEQRIFPMPVPAKGCDILSNGSGGCTGACRNRCGDEPYAGGVQHAACGGPRTCGLPSGSEFVACKVSVPQCPATFPGTPGIPLIVPPSPADPTFLNTKSSPPVCSNLESCPGAVDYRGGAVQPLPGGSFPECMTNAGQPVSRVGGSCPCLSGGSPVARGPNGMCPAGAEDSYPVTTVTPSGGDNCPPIPEIEPVMPSEAPSCPWVADFGVVRRECEAVPCCCQFNPETKRARTGNGAVGTADYCEGGCPGGCRGWIEANMGTASATSTVSTSSLKSTSKNQSKKTSTPNKNGRNKK